VAAGRAGELALPLNSKRAISEGQITWWGVEGLAGMQAGRGCEGAPTRGPGGMQPLRREGIGIPYAPNRVRLGREQH